MKLPLWLTAEQALALLKVRPQTLYANVSRGRIRARADATDSRRSLYHRDDVARQAARAHGRRSTEAVARQTIQWGDPVMPTAVSTVSQGRLWYRGHDACALAEHASLEEVAGLLWDCAPPAWEGLAPVPAPRTTVALKGSLQRVFVALATHAAADLPSSGRPPAALRAEAAQLLRVVADALLGSGSRTPLHQHIAHAWRRPKAADLLRRALVLMAEHELNTSTFAARVTASTGASLASSLLSGLATLAGPAHGGAVVAAHALVTRAIDVGGAAALAEWMQQGRRVRVFGHPMYPAGDARAAALLQHLALPPRVAELQTAGAEVMGEAPNVDFPVAVMMVGLRLPPEASMALYTLARSVGWLAHAMEQRAEGRLIRPRAHYTGPAPEGGRTQPR